MRLISVPKHRLSSAQLEQLADMPPEEEWLRNLTNEKTQRAYRLDVRECRVLGASQLRRAQGHRPPAHHRLAPGHEKQKALARDGPPQALGGTDTNEGATRALGARQARKLLEAPPGDTLKGVRDRAILATLLYHGLRCTGLTKYRFDARFRIGPDNAFPCQCDPLSCQPPAELP